MSLMIHDNVAVLEGTIHLLYEEDMQKTENGLLKGLYEKERFQGKEGEVFYQLTEAMHYAIYVGLGTFAKVTRGGLVASIAKGVQEAKKLKLESFGVTFIEANDLCPGGVTRVLAEAIRLPLYAFNKYKTDAKAYAPKVYLVDVPEDKCKPIAHKLEKINNLLDGVIEARNLVNEPANVMYPVTLAERVQAIGQEVGFEVEVFDEVKIQEIGMKAFWEVAKGSEHKPRFIIMRYMGNPASNEKVGFVGKGLTYDTGGYSLKPSASMDTMKSDMGGAAAVIGTMQALAKNKVKANVIAVIAACENAISGGSYKPGDVIGSLAGKTIEVLNTDAEGRLTLVDALTYILDTEKVDKVIDVATLTGAVLVALGTTITGVISNNDAFYGELEEAAGRTGEKFWRLPNDESYKKLIKGDVADLKNIGGRHAGTITAGMFIEAFAQDKPWIHLDIAGTGWAENASDPCMPKGGTGTPVRTLYEMVAKRQKHKA